MVVDTKSTSETCSSTHTSSASMRSMTPSNEEDPLLETKTKAATTTTIGDNTDQYSTNGGNDDGSYWEQPSAPKMKLVLWFLSIIGLFLLFLLVVIIGGVLQNPHVTTETQEPPSFTTSNLTKTDLIDIASKALESLSSNISKTMTNRGSSASGDYCECTVLLLRHCDDLGLHAKDDYENGDKHCSHLGYQRTMYLTTLFGSKGHENSTNNMASRTKRWPNPSHLYAQLPKQPKGVNYRQIETILPLAKQTKVPIQIVQDPQQLAIKIFENLQEIITTTTTTSQKNGNNNKSLHERNICNQVMVVAWKHAFLPEVAANLGCSTKQGCLERYPDEDFDQVWQLQFVYNPPQPKTMEEVLLQQEQDELSMLLIDDYGLLPPGLLGNNGTTTSTSSSLSPSSRLRGRRLGKDKNGNGNGNDDKTTNGDYGWTVYGSRTFQNFDPLAFHNSQL